MNVDLHLHSCLSPCGDPQMRPEELVGFSLLNGVELIALTDHNSVRNCPAASAAAAAYGIGFIPGAEVTSSEDVHCVCLFPELDAAMFFGAALEAHSARIQNRPDIFGNQTIVHPGDEPDEEYPWLLLPATDLSILELPAFVRQFGGLCYPAHVDRDANGLFAMLGTWPEEFLPHAVEIRHRLPDGVPASLPVIQASDAHRLEDLPEGGFQLPLASPDFAGLAAFLGVS